MPKHVERLAAFLAVLPRRVKHAIEFREPSWYDDDVMRLLRQHNVALCLHDMAGSATERAITARFTYVRFHGTTGPYNGAYADAALDDWAEWLVATNVPGFVYFNNDAGGHAPRDAKKLIDRLAAGQHLNRSRVNRHVPVAVG